MSSSVIVSDAPVTAPAPWLLLIVPGTVTGLSAASTSLFTAVIVTRSALLVAPAAIVIRLFGAAGTVYAPDTADTVIVVAALEVVPLSVADTVAVPPFSAIDDGVTASVAVGAASLSVSVSVAPDTVPAPWLFCAVPSPRRCGPARPGCCPPP